MREVSPGGIIICFVSAGVAAIKASEDQLAWGSGNQGSSVKDILKGEAASEPFLLHVQPVLVLDGQLLAAVPDDAGELQVSELAGAPMRFHYRSPSYDRHCYHIDLVTLPHLPEYVRQLEARNVRIVEALLRATGANSKVIAEFCSSQRELAERAWGKTTPRKLVYPLAGRP
jgi:hypothetical protein